MTEQEQQTFIERLEEALSWMKAVQENLRENDNTQGPWNALEARLRETEKIHQSEHDGHVKMDMALVAAEHLLESGDEKLRNHTLAKLKDLKSFWEETCTYIIHCHSRIEWVWLHWSEYLKAHQEFVLWLTRQQLDLDVGVELQLGLKEKLWQVDQQRVVVSDVHGQKALLERLIDEAAVLHNRTQDPSLDSQAREKLLKTYSDIRDKVEERLSLLQEIAEEHQTYQGSVQRFQSWLLSKTKELTDLMEKEDTTENKLQALQVFDDIVGNEEKTLQYIESVAESVRAKTSPAGADVVVDEAEELRLGWQRLRQGIFEVEEGLQSTLYTHNEYTTRCKRLEQDIGRLQSRLQELNLELKEDCNVGDDTDSIDEQVDQWRNYMRVRKTLIGEESQVDHLKLQLKELFRFSEDSRHISDHVLDVVKEHQSVKCKATKLCSDSEACLRNMFQEKLVFFTQWRNTVSQILETSAEVMDFSHIVTLVQNTERLLKDSIQLQDRLNDLRTIEDLCDSLFGPEKSDGLRSELSTAIRDRELLHVQLIQRKARLQGLISRTNDFGDAYVVIRSKLTSLTDRMMAIERPQPDILAKKSQSDQFMVIQKDVEDCEAHIIALETLISSCQNNQTQFEKLYADWKHLHKTIGVKLQESEERIADHSNFHDRLLNLQKWLMIMKQKLESFKSPKGEWSIESREHEAQRALGEFPEKEFQLQQMEMHGHRVLKNTSEEGRVHIVGDMKHLQESWLALYSMSLNIHRLLNGSIDEGQSVTTDMSVREVDGECTVHSEGQSILPGMQDEHPKLSGKGMGGHHSHAIDEYDLSTWTIQSKAGLPLAKESPEDTNPKTDISRAGDSYTLNTAKSSLVVSPEEGTMSPEEGAMAIEESQAIGKAMIFRDASAKLQAITSTQDKTMKADLYESRRRKFEAWLCKENKLLSSILSNQGAILKGKKLKMQQDTLSALWSRVTWGQEQFQLLLQENGVHKTRSGQAVNASLEELRYRWMLYKSKLKAVGGLGTTYSSKKPGLLQRVCRLALPLWILFLALLLLAFILPLVDEGNSCSISNNFARSFSVMLRYSGPPPT
ncbi:nesprin-3 isoform X1 [Corythoichthys intestinalis]|uniref:nesprin-3 isoform X1 n=1 Tax=Corythoichthys intestinalis TaxID=161448 RepID=UPI0025A5FF33|nr:nesprin-3 isoform X1 [Corythoichthys intestinalis]